jgi:hypothetical protein
MGLKDVAHMVGEEQEPKERTFTVQPGSTTGRSGAQHYPERKFDRARMALERGHESPTLVVMWREIQQLKAKNEALQQFCEEVAKTSQKTQVLSLWKKIKERLEG